MSMLSTISNENDDTELRLRPAALFDRSQNFFDTEMDESRLDAVPNVYPWAICSSNHFQLCQSLTIDDSDEACLAGDRFYFISGRVVMCIDLRHRVMCQLFACRFRPQSLHAKNSWIVTCGDGDQIVIADTYTGEIVFETEKNGSHLTNCVRLFWPSVVNSTVEADYNVVDDNEISKNASTKQKHSATTEGVSTELQNHFISERLTNKENPTMHLLVGGNTAGVSVYSLNSAQRIADIAFPTFINEIRVNPAGDRFVALGDNDEIYFVDITCLSDGSVRYERSVKREFVPTSPDSTIGPGGFSAAWSPDGRRLACLRENPGLVQVLDARSLDVLGSFHGSSPNDQLRAVAYNEDYIVYTQRHDSVHIVDAHDFSKRQVINVTQLKQRLDSPLCTKHRAVFDDELQERQQLLLKRSEKFKKQKVEAEKAKENDKNNNDNIEQSSQTSSTSSSSSSTHTVSAAINFKKETTNNDDDDDALPFLIEQVELPEGFANDRIIEKELLKRRVNRDTNAQRIFDVEKSPIELEFEALRTTRLTHNSSEARLNGIVLAPGRGRGERRLIIGSPEIIVLREHCTPSLQNTVIRKLVSNARRSNQNVQYKALYHYSKLLLNTECQKYNEFLKNKAKEPMPIQTVDELRDPLFFYNITREDAEERLKYKKTFVIRPLSDNDQRINIDLDSKQRSMMVSYFDNEEVTHVQIVVDEVLRNHDCWCRLVDNIDTVFESLDEMLRTLPPFTGAITFASLYEFAMAYDRTTTLDYQLRDVDIDMDGHTKKPYYIEGRMIQHPSRMLEKPRTFYVTPRVPAGVLVVHKGFSSMSAAFVPLQTSGDAIGWGAYLPRMPSVEAYIELYLPGLKGLTEDDVNDLKAAGVIQVDCEQGLSTQYGELQYAQVWQMLRSCVNERKPALLLNIVTNCVRRLASPTLSDDNDSSDDDASLLKCKELAILTCALCVVLHREHCWMQKSFELTKRTVLFEKETLSHLKSLLRMWPEDLWSNLRTYVQNELDNPSAEPMNDDGDDDDAPCAVDFKTLFEYDEESQAWLVNCEAFVRLLPMRNLLTCDDLSEWCRLPEQLQADAQRAALIDHHLFPQLIAIESQLGESKLDTSPDNDYY